MDDEPERELAMRRVSLLAVDAAFGIVGLTVATAGQLGRRIQSLAQPVARAALRPDILPPRLQPATVVDALVRRGAGYRAEARHDVAILLDQLVPRLVTEVLRRVDLTQLVLQHVDLNRVVLNVDVDALATRVDLEAVLDRLDLTEIVRRHVDLDGLVAVVDLDAAAAQLDLDAVIQRVDLVALAQDVIAEIDLPEIIRDSTGAVASDTLLGVRMQSMSGDDAIGRGMDRLRLRLRGRGAASDGPEGTT